MKRAFSDSLRMERLLSVLDGDTKRVVSVTGRNGLLYATALKAIKREFGNPCAVSFFKLHDQRELVKKNKLCFNCLSSDHMISQCQSKHSCKLSGCNKRHHTLLHRETSTKNSVTLTNIDANTQTLNTGNAPPNTGSLPSNTADLDQSPVQTDNRKVSSSFISN